MVVATRGFSALQRAEIAEILAEVRVKTRGKTSFSALQRAEIAEMCADRFAHQPRHHVSVLFNEPKLLKYTVPHTRDESLSGFSALQRAEIAEITHGDIADEIKTEFQCSSTSRNC